MKSMILRFIQMEIGFNKPGFAKKLAEESKAYVIDSKHDGIEETTVKRRMRQDRSEARTRQKLRKHSRWN